MSKQGWWDEDEEDDFEEDYDEAPWLKQGDSFQTDVDLRTVDKVEYIDSRTGDFCVKSGDQWWMVEWEVDENQWRGVRQVDSPSGE